MKNTYQFTLDGIEIEVTKKKVKNLNLTVHPDSGRVRMSAPHRLSQRTVQQFAKDKLPWIRKQLGKANQHPNQPVPKYGTGEIHYFLGKPYPLNVIEQSRRGSQVAQENGSITLYMRPGSTPAQRQKALQEWYRGELKKRLPPLIKKWEGITGEPVSEWGIKRMKTRWGTCNIGARRIWINLELAKRPPECLEYIVVHEIVHLKERLHNKRFAAYMNEYLPGWQEIKKRLNQPSIS